MASKHSKVTEISLDTVWLPDGTDPVRTVLMRFLGIPYLKQLLSDDSLEKEDDVR